jgi:putative transposase
MVKCHNRAKSISDASWYQFRLWIEHFAKKFGKKAIAVPPHNTSQECCICGKKVQKELKVRTPGLYLWANDSSGYQCGYQHFVKGKI